VLKYSTLKTTKNTFVNFPEWVMEKWQDIADILAESIGIPAALVMKTEDEFMEVFISSHSKNNPYHVGDKEKWDGLYCEMVIKTQNKLLVTNAQKDNKWDKNPDIKLGMISYLGFPINFPDNQPFGTLCVLDNKERPFTALDEKLILQFKNGIELDLALIQTFDIKTNELVKTIKEQQSKLSDKNIELQIAKEISEESEKRYQLLIDNIMYPVLVTSFEGNILYINQKTAGFLAIKADEYQELKSLDLWVDKSKRDEYIMELRTKGFIYNKEVQFRNKYGQIITVMMSSNIIDYYGRKAIFSIYNDISERKKAEEELRESQRKLVTLMGNLPGLAYRCKNDPDWTMIFMSEGCFELTGFYSQELEGNQINSYGRLIHQDDAEMVWQKVQDAINNHTFWQIEYRINTKDGIEKWVWEQGCGVYSNAGDLEVLEGFISDNTERKLLEDNLKQSEERLSCFINSASDSFYLLDSNLDFIEINRKALEIVGKQKIDIIGKNIADIVPDVKSSGRYEKYLEVIKTGKPFTIEDFIPHPVFGDRNFVLNSFKVGTGLGVIVYDITLLKKQDLELRKLLKTIENTEVSIVVTNVDGNIEYANPFFTKLTGYSKDEYLGKTPRVLNSGIQTDEFYKGMWDTIKSGNTWEGEFCNRKKNGELYWEKSIITPIKNEKEEILNFVAVKSDITNEKKHKYLIDITLEIYEKSEHLKIEEILKYSIDLGIQLTNSEIGFFHFVNDNQETISLQAWSAKTMDICNIPTFDKHYPISKAGVWVDSFYQKKPVFHNDYSGLSHKKGLPEGHATITRDLSVPVIIENKVVAIFGVGNKKSYYNEIDAEFLSAFAENVWNIVRRKKAETDTIKAKEKAEEGDRLKSAFLANMSHEIRTPMNGILGFSALLSEPGLESEEQQEYIKLIQKSGTRMLNIISEIMDISKIESGLTGISIKEVNINKQLEFVYKLLKPDAEVKAINLFIKNSLPMDEATIFTDEEKLYGILSNLVKNAIKYTDKGSIEFGYDSTSSPGKFNELQFYVKDTGIGIPKDRQEAIFERFIQADIADVQARQGVGLGLSIAKAYVEMLGGKIWVESEKGKGSEFYFTLPYITEPEAQYQAAKSVNFQKQAN
jgi:PAS domain S-box-containing protein